MYVRTCRAWRVQSRFFGGVNMRRNAHNQPDDIVLRQQQTLCVCVYLYTKTTDGHIIVFDLFERNVLAQICEHTEQHYFGDRTAMCVCASSLNDVEHHAKYTQQHQQHQHQQYQKRELTLANTQRIRNAIIHNTHTVGSALCCAVPCRKQSYNLSMRSCSLCGAPISD